MNLAELQKEVHAIAEARGWYDTGPTFEDSIASIHGALNEVLEEYRSCGMAHNGNSYAGQPFGIAAELADVVIHLAAMAEHYEYSLDPDETIEDWDALRVLFEGLQSLGDWQARLNWFAAEASRYEGSDILVEDALASVVVGVKRMSAHYGIDLDAAIEAKVGTTAMPPPRSP